MKSKLHLLRTIVIETLLYAAEFWTLTTAMERKIQAFEMKAYRRLLHIPYIEHITSAEVRDRVVRLIGQHDDILTMVKQSKFNWFGHVCRAEGTLSNDILHGLVEVRRGRGKPSKSWMTNVENWTGMGAVEETGKARDRYRWRQVVSETVRRRPP
jgi:hypothetical protein